MAIGCTYDSITNGIATSAHMNELVVNAAMGPNLRERGTRSMKNIGIRNRKPMKFPPIIGFTVLSDVFA
jgi:hypothetical protein